MNQNNVVLIAALIAAFASIANVYIGYVGSKSLEEKKWEIEREDKARENTMTAFSEYAKEIATGTHEVVWLLWIAKFNPHDFNQQEIEKYNKRAKQVLPNLIAANVNLAAHNHSIQHEAEILTKKYLDLDAQIGLLAVEYSQNSGSGLEKLQLLYVQAQELEAALPKKLSEIIGLVYSETN